MKVKGQIALVLVTLVDCLVTKNDLFTTVFWSNVQKIHLCAFNIPTTNIVAFPTRE